jgi:hypothetical protein
MYIREIQIAHIEMSILARGNKEKEIYQKTKEKRRKRQSRYAIPGIENSIRGGNSTAEEQNEWKDGKRASTGQSCSNSSERKKGMERHV